MRKRPSFAKIFRSPSPIPCENFCRCETDPWHTSAISQPKPPFCSYKTAVKSSKASFRSLSTLYETPPWHTSAISQPHTPISQLRNGLQNGLRKCVLARKLALGYEISPLMQKAQPSLKFQFKSLNCYFPFHTGHLPYENPHLVRKLSHARAPFPEDLRLSLSPMCTSDHPLSTFSKLAMAKT